MTAFAGFAFPANIPRFSGDEVFFAMSLQMSLLRR
jgi:hypothetical protein